MYDIFAELLAEKGLTPYKVYKATGVAQSSLSDWKNGKSKPKYESMKKIADYLGVSVDYLLYGTEPANEQKEKPAPLSEADPTFDDFTYAMHNEGKELSEEDKQTLLAMAKFLRQQKGQQKNEKGE